jgi:hypothetical protein
MGIAIDLLAAGCHGLQLKDRLVHAKHAQRQPALGEPPIQILRRNFPHDWLCRRRQDRHRAKPRAVAGFD